MIDPDETLVRIVSDHFAAGIVVKDDKVILAAPILKYMTGWSSDRVRQYVSKKGWGAFVVKRPNLVPFDMPNP